MRMSCFPPLILLALLWVAFPCATQASEKAGASVWAKFIGTPLAITLSGRFYNPQTEQTVDLQKTFETQKDIDAIVRVLRSAALRRLPDAEAACYFDKDIRFSALTFLNIEFQYADKPSRELFTLNGLTLIFDRMVFETDQDVILDLWPLVK